MTQLTLVIGNKNSSSWSLRSWLALKQTGQDFTEVHISLDTPTTHKEILRYSPSGKVPFLSHGNIKIWESLAICEYLAERFPAAHLWPEDLSVRSLARSISAEMHAGFQSLRQSLPMNCCARLPGRGIEEPGVQEDIKRITTIWSECRHKFGANGNMLFGQFTIADAMFAPIVSRFITYDIKLDSVAEAYAKAVWVLPIMQEWVAAASAELEGIASSKV